MNLRDAFEQGFHLGVEICKLLQNESTLSDDDKIQLEIYKRAVADYRQTLGSCQSDVDSLQKF